MTKAAPAASPSDWPRILLGCAIGAVLGLLALGAVLAAWWLAIARHEVQTTPEPEGLEARLAAAAGPAAFGLTPVYAYDPKGAGAAWLAQITPELEAQGRQIRPVPADDLALGSELDRLARRWAEPGRRPLLLWRDAEGLSLCRCDHPRARALARQALARQADAAQAQPPVAPRQPRASARRADPTGRAYPQLGPPPPPLSTPTRPTEPASVGSRANVRPAPPAPSLPGDPPPAQASALPPAPRRASPRRTDPPEARRDAESLFF